MRPAVCNTGDVSSGTAASLTLFQLSPLVSLVSPKMPGSVFVCVRVYLCVSSPCCPGLGCVACARLSCSASLRFSLIFLHCVASFIAVAGIVHRVMRLPCSLSPSRPSVRVVYAESHC